MTNARFLFIVLLTALVAPLLPGCAKNPATGRSQFNVLSREDEIALGAEAMPELIAGYGGAIQDARLNSYFTGVGMTMVPHTESDFASLPWEFVLLDSEVINAFALPGGKVFLSRGLAEKFTSEAQLAGVLGHEIGHVTAQHADERIGQQMGIAIGAAVAGILLGDDRNMQIALGAVVTGAGVFALSFSREQENEADRLGMRYMSRAGYDPVGMLQVMQVLRDASGGGGQPEWLSTHPLPETRIRLIQKRLEKDFAGQTGTGALGTYEDRFVREFLEPMKRLPPARHSASAGFDLGDPLSWCMVCAARARMD